MNKFFIVSFLIFTHCISAQTVRHTQVVRIHSHNDYKQANPFWTAYNNGAASIEADVVLRNDTLYVAHEPQTIEEGRTLETLYLQSIVEAFHKTDAARNLVILIDIKTEAYTTLDKLSSLLKRFVNDNRSLLQKHQLHFVISGNRPKPSDYIRYPNFISFDHQSHTDINLVPLEKVYMMSFNFRSLSGWRGQAPPTAEALEKVIAVIKKVHAAKKPVRFWATEDNETVWKQLAALGVDYIGTDDPERLSSFLQKK